MSSSRSLNRIKWNTKTVYFEDGLSSLLRVSSIPTTVIYDKQGQIFSRMNGFVAGDVRRSVDRSHHRGARAMSAFNRVIWIVLDSVGIGEMPDAADYGDAGSDTLGNIARQRSLKLPNLCSLGLGNIKPLTGLPPAPEPTGAFGRCTLASPGKDTTTGHWEMAGIHLEKPFPLYPRGFPSEIMQRFEERIGRKTLGNIAASGTEIIAAARQRSMSALATPIVYTSADSVFQIAAHEEVIPIAELYRDLLRSRASCCAGAESAASSPGRLKARTATTRGPRTVKTLRCRRRKECCSIALPPRA